MQLPNSQPPWTPMPPPQAREPRRYGAIPALVLSFFSAELYRDVGRRWRGIGFWYLVLLMFLTAVPIAIKAHLGFSKFARTSAHAMVSTFPSITITKGTVASDPDPCLWTEPDSGQVMLYVDSSGAFDDVKGQNAPLKLSDKKLTVRKSPTETTVYDLAQMPDMSVDKTMLGRWIDIAASWAGLAIFGIIFFFPLIGHLLQVLLYGVFGLVFCAMFNTKLDYAALLRLAVVALTPTLIVDCALDMAGVTVPYPGWIYFAMEMAFLLFAVKANAAGQSAPPGGFPVTWAQPPMPYPPPVPGGYGALPPGPYTPP